MKFTDEETRRAILTFYKLPVATPDNPNPVQPNIPEEELKHMTRVFYYNADKRQMERIQKEVMLQLEKGKSNAV